MSQQITGLKERLFGFGKSQRRQDMLILDEYGSITDTSLEGGEGKGYAADDKLFRAWVIDGENQILDSRTNRYVQLGVAWSIMPISLHGNEHKKLTQENINSLASAREDEELYYIQQKEKEGRMKWLGRIAFLVIAVDVVLIMWQLLSVGTLKIPFVG